MSDHDQPATRAGGLLVRKTAWRLSWAGRFVVLLIGIMAGLFAVRFIHPFLAVTHHSGGRVMVVEGWIPTHTLKEAAQEFAAGRYERVVVVRGTADELGNQYDSGRYGGDYVATILIQNGVPRESVKTLFFPAQPKDRTYQAALAVKHWFAEQRLSVTALDVVTIGPHARRSRLVYEKAFGGNTEIGIVALHNSAYDAAHWWRSSEGVREVIGESIAYLYARFLFYPNAEFQSDAPSP